MGYNNNIEENKETLIFAYLFQSPKIYIRHHLFSPKVVSFLFYKKKVTNMYRTYLCKSCKSDFILIEYYIKRTNKPVCPYCQSTHIREEGKYEDLKRTMEEMPNK